MRTVRVKGYAKLNLTLDLLGKYGDYHALDSLVVTVDLFDSLTLRAVKDQRVSVKMYGLGCEQIPPVNNAYKAAVAFRDKFQTNGAEITVHRNIPVGGGMGGSSADTAAVLRGMAKLYGVKDETALKELADGLGSDTGYLLKGGFARLRGRGEKIDYFSNCPPLYFLVLLPRSGVSTKECFRLSDENPPLPPVTELALRELLAGNYEGAGKYFSNGLYPAAARLNQEVKEAVEAVKSFSPLGASMTGSGSAAFACFDSLELAAWAKSRYRGNAEAIVVKAIVPQEKIWRNPFSLGE